MSYSYRLWAALSALLLLSGCSLLQDPSTYVELANRIASVNELAQEGLKAAAHADTNADGKISTGETLGLVGAVAAALKGHSWFRDRRKADVARVSALET